VTIDVMPTIPHTHQEDALPPPPDTSVYRAVLRGISDGLSEFIEDVYYLLPAFFAVGIVAFCFLLVVHQARREHARKNEKRKTHLENLLQGMSEDEKKMLDHKGVLSFLQHLCTQPFMREQPWKNDELESRSHLLAESSLKM